jgi:hypothetical protein
MRDYIQELRCIGVPPLKIQLALQARGVHLSCGQIHNLCRPGCLAAFTYSSSELISWVVDHGGACYSYDERIQDDVIRVAIFTQLPDERQVIHEFGDILEIDGTHAPLKTNWEIVPITLMDCVRHIQCGGIMFAAFVTTEVIAWLLGLLIEICHFLSDTWQALITDEDSAFIPAVEQFQGHFYHVFSAMHREANFLKKLNCYGSSKVERE